MVTLNRRVAAERLEIGVLRKFFGDPARPVVEEIFGERVDVYPSACVLPIVRDLLRLLRRRVLGREYADVSHSAPFALHISYSETTQQHAICCEEFGFFKLFCLVSAACVLGYPAAIGTSGIVLSPNVSQFPSGVVPINPEFMSTLLKIIGDFGRESAFETHLHVMEPSVSAFLGKFLPALLYSDVLRVEYAADFQAKPMDGAKHVLPFGESENPANSGISGPS